MTAVTQILMHQVKRYSCFLRQQLGFFLLWSHPLSLRSEKTMPSPNEKKTKHP